MEIDIHRIEDILPHRYPFLLIDRITDVTPGESLRALKNVTINEPFFSGHFPHRPVFPGVLMLESIAQASAVLVSLIIDAKASRKNVYLFAGVDKARFRSPPSREINLSLTLRSGLTGGICGAVRVLSQWMGRPSAPRMCCLRTGQLSDR